MSDVLVETMPNAAQIVQVKLCESRTQLADCLRDMGADIAQYEITVARYVNAINDLYFLKSADSSHPNVSWFSTVAETATMMKSEIFMITGQSGCGFGIEERLREYMADDVSQWSQENNLPILPRSVMHTFIDLIDDVRPIPKKRRK